MARAMPEMAPLSVAPARAMVSRRERRARVMKSPQGIVDAWAAGRLAFHVRPWWGDRFSVATCRHVRGLIPQFRLCGLRLAGTLLR